ncbi:hypothetical protein TNIN_418571 [Trichonephila inaurata madagascariensis]|uniref:Uncharacterized protein n=1 Tax=Trichonephila inaurata madagascariensis TaxID=2747483 RepID=A0A8X7CH26_9ARAC|nr:hypothetical protein TNIN_418571 [Trichonephila inaurata madagascariensis]
MYVSLKKTSSGKRPKKKCFLGNMYRKKSVSEKEKPHFNIYGWLKERDIRRDDGLPDDERLSRDFNIVRGNELLEFMQNPEAEVDNKMSR